MALLPKKATAVGDDQLEALQHGYHRDPHTLLGARREGKQVIIRTRRPFAETVQAILPDESSVPLKHLRNGIWEGKVKLPEVPDYLIEATYLNDAGGNETWLAEDPYRFMPTVGDVDLYLFARGEHERLWDFLGCRLIEHHGISRSVSGAAFSVWAPAAQAVRVVGDFNSWDGTGSMMRCLGTSGVWELFIPGVQTGSAYKFEILTQQGEWVLKADPMARFTEKPSLTASRTGTSDYVWQDDEWLAARKSKAHHTSAMSIYELHLGSWKPGYGYRDLADPLIDYVSALGFTHVEFMPLTEHPYGGSWGYQVSSYYAPTARFGSPDDLKYLIDRLHTAGIGVIMDWVPAHFPKDAWALAQFDGTALYEYTDPARGEHPDWGTLIFDFGRNEVRNFLICSALYWLGEYHMDGLRVDAVASMLYLDYSREDGQWIPNVYGGNENLEAISLLQHVNATAYRLNPGIMMIAEESTSWPKVTGKTVDGGLGFGFKWNMGWMHDSLEYIQVDAMWRSDHRDDITRSMLYQYSENYVLPISHDEVVHGKGSLYQKMPGDDWQKRASIRSYLAFMWAHPGKKLLFMGQEFGQRSEWNEGAGLQWDELDLPEHQALFTMVTDLNRVYRETRALWQLDIDPKAFSWLDTDGNRDVVAMLRWDTFGTPVVAVINFGGHHIFGHQIGLPRAGQWHELFNTDAALYGGTNTGNQGQVTANDGEFGGQPATATLTIPALGAVYLTPHSS